MKIRPVGAGRKDLTKLIVDFRNFTNAPNKLIILWHPKARVSVHKSPSGTILSQTNLLHAPTPPPIILLENPF